MSERKELRFLGLLLLVPACNEPPGPALVELGPTSPTTLDDLVVEVVEDAPDTDEGDTVSYQMAWFEDGELVQGENGASLPASLTAKGQTWRVEVTPTDGSADGPTTADEVMIINSVPDLEVSISPDSPTSAHGLEAAVTVTDADDDSVQYTCRWTRNGEVVEEQSCAISDSETVREDEWTVVVEGDDGEDSAEPATATAIIQNGLPEVHDLVLNPAEPTVEDVLAVDFDVYDSDGDPVTVLVEWQVDGVLVQSGAGTDLTEASPARGSSAAVTVTANDGFDDGLPTTATVEIVNAAPSEPVVRIRPGWPRAGLDDAVCIVKEESTDADGDSLSYEITWTVDGTPYTGEVETTTHEGDTIPAELLGATETWTCGASAYDGLDFGPTGTWQAVPTCPDIDCDSHPDIIFVNLRSNESYYDNPVYVYLGGADRYAESRRIELPTTRSMSADVADLDNDGFLDVFVAVFEDGLGSYYANSFIYWGNGAGVSTVSPYELPTYAAKNVDIADLDDDGFQDLVVGSHYGGKSNIFWGSAEGFSSANISILSTLEPSHTVVADIDGDSELDIVFSNRQEGGNCSIDSYVYWGESGVFSEKNRLELPTHCAQEASASDLDQDGWIDLVFSNEKQKAGDTNIYAIDSYIYWGSAEGFSAADRSDFPTVYARGNTVADLDADGFQDIVFSNYFDGDSYLIDSTIYWGTLAGPTASLSEDLSTSGALDVDAGDLDGDGFIDVVFANARDAGGDYDADSTIYWGSVSGFSPSDATYLPTLNGRSIVLVGVE